MRAVYLENKKEFMQNESFQLTFIIKDSYNDVITSFTNYKFYCEITDETSYEIIKEDANYSGGSANEITTSGNKLIIYINEDETDDWEGDFGIEVYMVHKTTGDKYCIYNDTFKFLDTITS